MEQSTSKQTVSYNLPSAYSVSVDTGLAKSVVDSTTAVHGNAMFKNEVSISNKQNIIIKRTIILNK